MLTTCMQMILQYAVQVEKSYIYSNSSANNASDTNRLTAGLQEALLCRATNIDPTHPNGSEDMRLSSPSPANRSTGAPGDTDTTSPVTCKGCMEGDRTRLHQGRREDVHLGRRTPERRLPSTGRPLSLAGPRWLCWLREHGGMAGHEQLKEH